VKCTNKFLGKKWAQVATLKEKNPIPTEKEKEEKEKKNHLPKSPRPSSQTLILSW
jgi:hypothetical protein